MKKEHDSTYREEETQSLGRDRMKLKDSASNRGPECTVRQENANFKCLGLRRDKSITESR